VLSYLRGFVLEWMLPLERFFLCDNRICNGVLLVMLRHGLAALQKVYRVTCPDTTGHKGLCSESIRYVLDRSLDAPAFSSDSQNPKTKAKSRLLDAPAFVIY